MTKSALQQALLDNYSTFMSCLRGMPEATAHYSKGEKWSPAQQLEHLAKSVRPVTLAFSFPKFLLPILFGKANRPSRSYDELVDRYKSKLAAGGKSSKPFIPGKPGNLNTIYQRLERHVRRLTQEIDRFSDAELDLFILPHPLLGKITFREMLYFTAYHAQHHLAQVEPTKQ